MSKYEQLELDFGEGNFSEDYYKCRIVVLEAKIEELTSLVEDMKDILNG
jgi:hypothetical protein